MILNHGSCLCQNIKYTLSGKALSMGICYCNQCQQSGGLCGSPLLVVRTEQFQYLGDTIGVYTTQSARGARVGRHFCRDCGSHLFAKISDAPGILTIKAATLIDLTEFTPQYLVWTQDARKFCSFPKGIPEFKDNAPMAMLLGIS